MARLAGTSGKPGPLARLTPRERSVLSLIGEGRTNRQIGERLFLAEKTVKNEVLPRRPPTRPGSSQVHTPIEPEHDDHRPEALNLLKPSEP